MMFGGKTDEAPSLDIIDHAIDAGINFLDTANVYSRERSEEVVGAALKRNGKLCWLLRPSGLVFEADG